MACHFLGVLHYGSDDFDQADTLLDEARRRFESEKCTAGLWGCRYDLGWLALASCHHDRAADEFERALQIGRSAGSEDLVAHSLAALAPVAALSGDATQAQSLAAEAIAITRSLGLRLLMVMALVRAAEVAILNRTDAATLLIEALAILRDVGGTAWLADALELTAVVQTGLNAPQQAARFLGVADRLTEVSGGRPNVRAIRSEIDHCRVEVAHALGAESFRLELAGGLAMSLRAAVDCAIDVLTRPGGTSGAPSRAMPHRRAE